MAELSHSPSFHKNANLCDPTGRFERSEDYIGICDSTIRYKAYDTETGLEVTWHEMVLKNKQHQMEEIVQRAERLKRLKHANLNTLFHYWVSPEGNKIAYITESTCVNSVWTNLTQGLADIRQKVITRWFLPVLQVLQYLHAQTPAITHNEINLKSILVKATSGCVKLTAPSLYENSELHLKVDPFMPPEFLVGQSGTFSDIWRFGLALLNCATGQIPYSECRTPVELIDKLKQYYPPASLSLVSDPLLKDLIVSCLRPPALRPTASDLISHPYFNQGPDEDDSARSSDAANNGLVVIFSGKSTRSNQNLPKVETGGTMTLADTPSLFSSSTPRIGSNGI